LEHSPELDLLVMNHMQSLSLANMILRVSVSCTPTPDNICEVYEAGWKDEGKFLVFRIRADRF
jgi:hypothetical protein